jgi:hypothetical protein
MLAIGAYSICVLATPPERRNPYCASDICDYSALYLVVEAKMAEVTNFDLKWFAFQRAELAEAFSRKIDGAAIFLTTWPSRL